MWELPSLEICQSFYAKQQALFASLNEAMNIIRYYTRK